MPTEIIPQASNNPHPLGRNINHDPRSLAYPFSARPEFDIQVISRPAWTRQIPILDQGNIGSCTGNAGVGRIATDDVDRPGLTSISIGDMLWWCDEALAIHFYSEATKIDPWPGVYPPDDTGSDGTSIANVLYHYGLIAEYTWAFNGLNDVLIALMSGPVMVGTYWYSSMFFPDASGGVSIAPNAYIAGGHEYLANGQVDVENKRLWFDNSWGSAWGNNGTFSMSFDTLDRLLNEQGDATIVHSTAIINPEPPTPEPEKPGCLPQWAQRIVDKVSAW